MSSKKIFILLFFSLNSLFFAQSHDLSVTASLSLDQTDYYYRGYYYHFIEKNDLKFGLSNYNFPFENTYFGFYESLSVGFLQNLTFDLSAGPAFSIPLYDFLKLQGGPALFLSLKHSADSQNDLLQLSFGLSTEFRLKFNTAKHFSIIAGADFSYSFLCYQRESTSRYIYFWWLEKYSRVNFYPFAALSFDF